MALSRFSFLLVPIALLAAAPPLSESYKDASSQIIAAALADQDGYAKLSYLCDRIGNRLSGVRLAERPHRGGGGPNEARWSEKRGDARRQGAALDARPRRRRNGQAGAPYAYHAGAGRQRGYAGRRHHRRGRARRQLRRAERPRPREGGRQDRAVQCAL